jgi:hypothetical protein
MLQVPCKTCGILVLLIYAILVTFVYVALLHHMLWVTFDRLLVLYQ